MLAQPELKPRNPQQKSDTRFVGLPLIRSARAGLIFQPLLSGTSVKMIEDYYAHITPAKNAERILQGIPGWTDRGATPAKPPTKK
jgi:hypothetical protein